MDCRSIIMDGLSCRGEEDIVMRSENNPRSLEVTDY